MTRMVRAVATDPCPRGSADVARTRGVSWLRAASLAFPTCVSGVMSARTTPVTVAGPRRTCTGFRNSRPRRFDCAVSLRAATFLVKRVRERGLELGTTTSIRRTFLLAGAVSALHARIELGDLTREALDRSVDDDWRWHSAGRALDEPLHV